ncbi:MAG: hypothetical protein H6729_04190 [Deltaproteobacteria bacterium]|nr:hypothetical protein [Deltaproteobacteria bacterium]
MVWNDPSFGAWNNPWMGAWNMPWMGMGAWNSPWMSPFNGAWNASMFGALGGAAMMSNPLLMSQLAMFGGMPWAAMPPYFYYI